MRTTIFLIVALLVLSRPVFAGSEPRAGSFFDEGYNWAKRHGVTNETDCEESGPEAFVNGCNKFVREQQAALEQ